MNRIRSILLMVAIAAPSLASAETIPFEDASAILGKSCAADVETNCRGVNLDAARLKDCLSRNQDSMSSQCKADYARAFDAIQKRAAARNGFAKICDRDTRKYCGGAQQEPAAVIGCLLATPKGMTIACGKALDEAGYR